LKMTKPFKNLSMAHGILSESHFSHIVCFCASFPQFLTEHNAHSLFHFLHHSNIMRMHTLLFFIWDCLRLREARVQVLTANRSRHVRTCCEEAASVGASWYWRANANPDTFCMYLVCFYPEVSWPEFCMNVLFSHLCYVFNLSLNSTGSQTHITEVH
jgi:hypothetical protein